MPKGYGRVATPVRRSTLKHIQNIERSAKELRKTRTAEAQQWANEAEDSARRMRDEQVAITDENMNNRMRAAAMDRQYLVDAVKRKRAEPSNPVRITSPKKRKGK